MDNLFSRTEILVGEQGTVRLKNASVFVAGLGGVGGYAVEALARAGIGRLTLLDMDDVGITNLNRQLIALEPTIGKSKFDLFRERIEQINPECHISGGKFFLNADNVKEWLEKDRYDYVVDCIDSLNSKVSLLETASQMGVRVIASMGAGGKLDPTKIVAADISKTHTCPLARFVRSRLKRRGVVSGIQTVFSTEKPRPPLTPESVSVGRDRSVNGSISYIPAMFGMMMAGIVIKTIVEQ